MKEYSLLLLLGLVVLACAHKHSSESRPEESRSEESSSEESLSEESRVDCARMMCRMFCPLGFHHDKNGCPLCTCIEDPCETMECNELEKCKPAPHCTGFPCYSMKAECVADVPCAMPMCANPCANGYRNDANGCMTCECAETIEENAEEEAEKEEPQDELCVGHVCPEAHSCVAVTPPFCQLLQGVACNQLPMCLPDAHNGMFLPHLADQVPGPVPDIDDIPDTLRSLCKFRQAYSEKIADEAKKKYANNSMLGRLLKHSALHSPWCSDSGKFLPLQCHAPDRKCWCVNDRGQALPGTHTTIKSKADVPSCVEHMTERIEGSFMLQHELEDAEPHLTKIASVVHDHMAEWMKIDHAQIIIRQVSQTKGGLIEVHFEVQRTGESELHSAELMLGWHLGKEGCKLPYQDSMLTPIQKSLKMQHHMSLVDEEGNVRADLPDEGLRMHTYDQHGKSEEDFMAFYHQNKIAVIVGAVGVVIFLIFFIAVTVTVCKRARVTSSHFKHKRMSEKSKTYKQNLAFANEIYGKQQPQKPDAEPDTETTEERTDATEA